jgi:outer membrane protein, heavy metal efflux system
MRVMVAVLGLAFGAAAFAARAQTAGSGGTDRVAEPLPLPLTRAAAVDAAITHGARLALARADSLGARATWEIAREYGNPTANLTYTRDTPHYHGILNLPFDYPWVRSVRVRSADLGRRSAAYRYAFERAAVRFDVDTTYTRALVAAERSRLSRRDAVDADSLRTLAVVRRDAGDASDMDVDLAAVNAGRQANVAAADSLAAVTALLDVQTVIGLSADRVRIALSDSLTLPPADTTAVPAAEGSAGPPLAVAAAQATLQSEQTALAVARRGALGQPAFQAGVEGGDPTQPFPLPTVGLSIPVPLFNRNHGEVDLATAKRDRAMAELEVARRESAAQIARARQELRAALGRVRRDLALLDAATHLAARTLTAFAEGAIALPNVLEAQHSVRDALGQYVDDLGAASRAAAAVRLFTLTTSRP